MTSRPLPDVEDPEFVRFWNGTRRGEIRVQACGHCHTPRWPPRSLCTVCHSIETEWVAASLTGTLHTWTVVMHQTMPGVEPPYVVGLVDLDEPAGIRLLGNVIAIAPQNLEIGMPLRAHFVKMSEHVTLVNWVEGGRP